MKTKNSLLDKKDPLIGLLTYCLKLPLQWKIHPMFHAFLLTSYKENDIHGKNYLRPPPDVKPDRDQYIVE
jgi:hypothetical protein